MAIMQYVFTLIQYSDRLNICNSVIFYLWSYREQYPECECLIDGDMNINLNSHHVMAS